MRRAHLAQQHHLLHMEHQADLLSCGTSVHFAGVRQGSGSVKLAEELAATIIFREYHYLECLADLLCLAGAKQHCLEALGPGSIQVVGRELDQVYVAVHCPHPEGCLQRVMLLFGIC